MKPSTELFDLIKSLSKSEKRFFKLTSSLQSGDKNYLKIFDYIEKQKDYDEERLKNHFKKDTFINHLPSEKNHLYKLILKSLRSYYSEQDINSIIKQEIKNVEILHKKALYKECKKFIKRAKKLARDYEKFYYLFELVSWQKKLLEEEYESGNFDEDLDALIEEESQIIEKLRNLAEYQILYSKINYVFRSGGFIQNEKDKATVDAIANYHLIIGKNTALSDRAATICYYIKGLCAVTYREYQESYIYFNKVRSILDRNPNIKSDTSKRYLMALTHLLSSYIDNKEYQKAEETIQDIRNLSKEKGFNNMDVKVSIFTSAFIAELTMHNRKGEFGKTLQIMDKNAAMEEELKDIINKEKEINIYFNKAYAYFGVGEYKKALSIVNIMINDNEQMLRQDLYSFSRVLNIMIHFELENYDFLEYVTKSTSRYLGKQDKDFTIETVFVKMISKIMKKGEENKNEILALLKKEMEELFQNKKERIILDYIDIESWVESKLNDENFADTVKRKNA
ncbi:MAG: hypothetical protein KDC84_09405 [Crocinitomicaceae bacterium]|nr:hypothetical protein [Crocinitomicaceae bacterium]